MGFVGLRRCGYRYSRGGVMTVSYTHLDVYKRQETGRPDTRWSGPPGWNWGNS
ncbi:hypothetical protein [Streptomyces fragilis]|uniref:hypothetical protein n=1 Tax=Streptomyces fragilis TaxID=67301 RepID=UPI0024DE20A9|nr:hypothetical protein [Streptomyces fragilis]